MLKIGGNERLNAAKSNDKELVNKLGASQQRGNAEEILNSQE
jgi:hypothetical protein